MTRRDAPERLLEKMVAAIGHEEAFAAHSSSVQDWQVLLDLAFDHGVAGVLFRRLASASVRVPIQVPTQIHDAAQRRLAVDRLWHQRLVSDLRQVLEAFDQAGLRAICLKGPLLSERLYPEPSLRVSGDLDLLVDPAAMEPARQVLERIGYRLHLGLPQHARVFEREGGATVDLHYRASGGFGTSLEAESFIANAVPYRTTQLEHAWILSPEDELVYLAVHAARHRFLRLRWLLDLQLFIQRHPDLSGEKIVARGSDLGVSRALAATGTVLAQRLRLALPGHGGRPGLQTRLALAVASWSDVDSQAAILKSYRVFWHVTYHALLGESRVAGARFWLRSLASSAARLARQALSGRNRSAGS